MSMKMNHFCKTLFLRDFIEFLDIDDNLFVGLAVMISIQVFGVTSGSHINPAVSVSAAIYGLITYPVNN